MDVIKRSGKEVPFDFSRIVRAITLANEKYQDLSEEKILDVASKVQKKCEKLNRNVQVEEIQDLVENELIKINAYRVAKHYIKYRYQKELERDRYSKLIEGIKEKLEARNITNQNANTDENSFGGRLNETNSLLMKQYALDYCMCAKSKNNHLNNEIYIHDLDHFPLGDHNCAHEDSWVYISKSKDGKASYSYLQLKDLAKEIGLTPGHIAYLDNSNYLILSRDGWTKLNNVTSRETADGEITYTIKTKSGLPLKLTGKHRLPTLREGKEVLAEVKDLKVGDSLLNMENIYLNDEDHRETVKRNDTYAYNGVSKHFNELQIVSITQDTDKHIVYDMETESHWYIINNYVSHNCMSMPIDKLLAEGFNTRQTDVRPSSGIHTALQLVAVLFQLQSLQQFGGVSATHLDWSMVPYVRKSYVRHYKHGLHYLENDPELTDEIRKILDNPTEYSITDPVYSQFSKKVADYADEMTWKETYQAVEALYHNLNTLQSRSGCQLPFSSINYGTCTLEEGRMVIKALLEISIKGIGKLYRTSIFPCGIFQLMKGVNRAPGDPNYDLYRLALKSTSLRLYPNYANCDWSGNAGYDRNDPKTYFSTMGKRKLQLI